MLISAKRVQILSDILHRDAPQGYRGMLAKSVLIFYRNLMFALIVQMVTGKPVRVTIPTGKLNSSELEQLERALTDSGWSIRERDRDYYLVVPTKEDISYEQLVMTGKMCPYCKKRTVYEGDRFECPDCHATVECHPGTSVAMGFVANSSLRKRRNKVHEALDELWRGGKLSRKEAYVKLREKMHLTKAMCHVARFNEEQCDKALLCIKQINEEM